MMTNKLMVCIMEILRLKSSKESCDGQFVTDVVFVSEILIDL